MAPLFEKPQSQKETVNDLHGDLINLARVVADETSSYFAKTRSTSFRDFTYTSIHHTTAETRSKGATKNGKGGKYLYEFSNSEKSKNESLFLNGD